MGLAMSGKRTSIGKYFPVSEKRERRRWREGEGKGKARHPGKASAVVRCTEKCFLRKEGRGRIFEKEKTKSRSCVAEPLRGNRLCAEKL